MKDLHDIIGELEQIDRRKEIAVLATLVKVNGSTYRRPGARLLMKSLEKMTGSLSAGCLERDVWERAKYVIQSGEPAVIKYDLTSDDDPVLGLGMGCKGELDILIERLPCEESRDYIAFLSRCIRNRQNGVLATVFRVEGDLNSKIGDRLFLDNEGTKVQYGDGELLEAIREDAQALLNKGRSLVKEYHVGSGTVEVLLELIHPLPLVIFGSGPDVVPVVRLAREIGWHVTVVDNRPLPSELGADTAIISPPEAVAQKIELTPRTAAVIMTHNYLQDLKLLEILLKSPLRYLGLMGPRQRTERLIRNLKEGGVTIADQELQRLYNPVGIDMAAETPIEIAIAIIAEIQAVVNSRSGGPLRDRQGPIHN